MKIFLMIVAILLGSTIAYAGNLNKIHGPNWDCSYLDSRFPKHFTDTCKRCEANGQDFFQDNKPKNPDDFESAEGHCVGEPTGGAREALRKRLHKDKPSASKKKSPKWYAVACGHGLTKSKPGGPRGSSGSAQGYVGNFDTEAEAEETAQAQCESAARESAPVAENKCKVRTTWNSGCGWVAIPGNSVPYGKNAACYWGPNKAKVLAECNAEHGECDIIGGCAK